MLLRTLAVLGASAAVLAGAGSAAPQDPILGLWSYRGSLVAVTTDGTGFAGTVVKRMRLPGSTCTHPAGQVVWRLGRSGTEYTGAHRFLLQSCAPGGLGAAS